jgi:hypothetical protein
METEKILKIIKDHETEAERKAESSLERGKFIMFGYWKAIGVHMRRLSREIRKSEEAG